MNSQIQWQLILGRRLLQRAQRRAQDYGDIAALESVLSARCGTDPLGDLQRSWEPSGEGR
jgi:hypothetical protein